MLPSYRPPPTPLRTSPHPTSQGFQGGEERKVNFTALLEADVSSLTYGVCGWQPRPSQTPGDPAYDPMQAMLLEKAVKIAHFREVDEWVAEVEAFTPEEAEPAERVLRSLKISLIFYNHNYNQYVQGTFLFDMKLSGQVKPFYAFRPFNLDPPTGSPNQGAEFLRSVFRRVRLWLVLVNTGMVLLRTFNEVKTHAHAGPHSAAHSTQCASVRVSASHSAASHSAARLAIAMDRVQSLTAARCHALCVRVLQVKTCISIFRKTRSCLAYFGGVYTILELFNLTCNYIGVVFRIYSILLNQRIGIEDLISNDNPEDVIETMGEPIALIEGVIVTARALSIISAMLLLFKYLELAPRRALPAVYLTGTTLGRAGRDLQMTFFCFLTLLLAFAITGEQLFGTTVEEFSSIPMAFFTLSICVSGSGAIYRKLAIYYPTMGPLYFVVFTMTHLVLVTPLFLATLNDAYSVRDEQMQLQAERKAAKEEARRLKKEKERKKQMM